MIRSFRLVSVLVLLCVTDINNWLAGELTIRVHFWYHQLVILHIWWPLTYVTFVFGSNFIAHLQYFLYIFFRIHPYEIVMCSGLVVPKKKLRIHIYFILVLELSLGFVNLSIKSLTVKTSLWPYTWNTI